MQETEKQLVVPEAASAPAPSFVRSAYEPRTPKELRGFIGGFFGALVAFITNVPLLVIAFWCEPGTYSGCDGPRELNLYVELVAIIVAAFLLFLVLFCAFIKKGERFHGTAAFFAVLLGDALMWVGGCLDRYLFNSSVTGGIWVTVGNYLWIGSIELFGLGLIIFSRLKGVGVFLCVWIPALVLLVLFLTLP